MRFATISLVILLSSACAGDAILGAACVSDAACDGGNVCAFGRCGTAGFDGELLPLHLEIESLDGAFARQSMLDVDARSPERLQLAVAQSVAVQGSLTLQGEVATGSIVAVKDGGIPGRALTETAQSDTGGRFLLRAAPDSSYRISIRPDDASLPPYDDTDATVVTASQDVVLDPIELAPTFSVSGQIVAGDGVAVVGIAGLDVRYSVDGRRVSSTARTDASGNFTIAFRSAPESGVLEIRASDDNLYFPSVDVLDVAVSPDTPLAPIHVGAVPTPVMVTVTVVGGDGERVAFAQVVAQGEVGQGQFVARGQTDNNGALALTLPAGSYRFAGVGPSADARYGIGETAVVISSATDVGLVLAPAVHIDGIVVQTGVEVAGAITFNRIAGRDGTREAWLGELPLAYAATVAADAFDVVLVPGRYRVTMQPGTFVGAPVRSAVVDISERSTGLTWDLGAVAILAGRLQMGDASAAPGYVRLFSNAVDEGGAAIKLGEASTSSDGSFELAVGLAEALPVVIDAAPSTP